MIELRFYRPKDFQELTYVLDSVQSQYTATANQALEKIEIRNQKGDFSAFPVTLFYNGKAVGFFVLDFGEDKFEFTENSDAVLLRSLSVNPEFQGKGIGKSAMLEIDHFLKNHFVNCNEIVLAVNEKNTQAFQLYIQTRYLHDGKMKIGRCGPQFVMRKNL
ncbi:GNAT family N-acetyltransferase [Chryseobacterium sp. JAH]|uniref:GNAT family N-acetyltransferase n=1 Tax=Chryseobacterium sp. JAH TaxID=1742858 RepID=UPI0006479BD1|nr:GNAT family N-acetyltransferase [Chryseobacterium sp. JAH]KUJ51234.1 GNAT family acetyltransferase [Chryseobacterium sp. JAH]